MGIYIEGMDTPKSWRDCPFSNGAAQCKLVNMEICDKQHTHRSICPITPVPTHGDLIDRDKFRSTVFIGEQCLYSWDELEDAIDYAPTVIPACPQEEEI